jgi:hypothetical protein
MIIWATELGQLDILSGQSHVKLHGSTRHRSFESIVLYLWIFEITYEIKNGV